MLIDANHLQLDLQGQSILHDVSLHLKSGDIYGLLGPNGAGKSTTIAVLLSLYQANNGSLKLFDKNIDDSVMLRRRIGVMPEHAGFYEWMTANDYLVWYASLYGGLQQSVSNLLHQVGLKVSNNKPISQFSRGMKQRLALARTLVHEPELLILDEPTNGLDPRGRREIHDLLLELAEESQVGILLCTHLLDDVERLCSKIGIIDHGRTITEGSLNELLGETHNSLRYRLRISHSPEAQALPSGINLLLQDGEWWHFEISSEQALETGNIWQKMMDMGWHFSEIHAESNRLEDLYLQLTDAKEILEQEKVT